MTRASLRALSDAANNADEQTKQDLENQMYKAAKNGRYVLEYPHKVSDAVINWLKEENLTVSLERKKIVISW